MEGEQPKLLFVYNSNSGLGHQAYNFLHKIVNPVTYQCSLCAITYGNFQMKKELKEFLSSLPYEVEFWYKNDFVRKYPQIFEFPCVLLSNESSLQLLLGGADMQQVDLNEMKPALLERVPNS